MEPEKPFKTIEVIDARTGQVCKIACMSCIRGHRTTSCGIPVCRSKVFWTVKRPGRPSNSCTCRFGPSGRCQCVVAKPTCPHKPRKGEKRSAECRCDEQGRYCCLLEPEHWDALCAMQKPRVEFFVNREAMDARHGIPPALPPTPSYSAGTPQTIHSVPSTPGQTNGVHFVNASGGHFDEMQSHGGQFNGVQSPQGQFNEMHSPGSIPRFGMMGVGTPMGHTGYQGQVPPTPRDYQPYAGFQQQQPDFATPPTHISPPQDSSPPYPSQQCTDYDPNVTRSLSALALPSQDPAPPEFDFDKMMTDYLNFQFPSAICQNCGLSGCTCRNCPPTMQNFESGMWANCCSRKHVKPSSSSHIAGQQQEQHARAGQPDDPNFSQMEGLQPTMDLSEFLIEDLEGETTTRQGGGCCCGDR